MNTKSDIQSLIDEVIDGIADEQWKAPCARCLDRAYDFENLADDVPSELAACVFYLVAVTNFVGGPSESSPYNPAVISEAFGIERAAMLSCYAGFLHAFEPENEYSDNPTDDYKFDD